MRALLASLLTVTLASSSANAETIEKPRNDLVIAGAVFTGLGAGALGLGALRYRDESFHGPVYMDDGRDHASSHTVSTVLFASGIGLIGIGVPMFIYGMHTRRTVAVAPVVDARVAGVSLVGVF